MAIETNELLNVYMEELDQRRIISANVSSSATTQRERERGDGYESVKSMPTWKQLRDLLMLQVDFEFSKVDYNLCCFYMCLFIVIYIIFTLILYCYTAVL